MQIYNIKNQKSIVFLIIFNYFKKNYRATTTVDHSLKKMVRLTTPHQTIKTNN
jgi:hypothetical protein